MLKRGIEWKLNPPGASRFGGAWERLISVRKILDALIDLQPLTDETLQTLMCEIEAIMNNRPLTPVSAEHRDLEPLTPNHILLLQGKSPDQMCLCTGDELIGRKMWKQAQYLADQFWLRWRREYIPLLQTRPGSLTRSRDNLAPGDIVLLVDETVPRGRWPLGRIEQVRKSRDGLVRSARVKTKNSLLDRPITKLVKIFDVRERPLHRPSRQTPTLTCVASGRAPSCRRRKACDGAAVNSPRAPQRGIAVNWPGGPRRGAAASGAANRSVRGCQ